MDPMDVLNTVLLASAPLALGLIMWRGWHRLGEIDRRPAFPPVAGMLLFIAMYVMGVVGSAIVRAVIYGDAPARDASDMPVPDLARVQIGSTLGQLAVVAVYVWIVRRGPRAARRGDPAAALTGAAAFVLVWPITAGASFLAGLVARHLRGETVEPIAHDTLQTIADATRGGWFWVMVVLLVVAVPVLEEVMYRGILQRTLRAMELTAWQAVLAASVIFALMHVGAARWHALPALFVLSIGFGWAYERTGRLAAPIVMHLLFNAANLGLVWLAGSGAGA